MCVIETYYMTVTQGSKLHLLEGILAAVAQCWLVLIVVALYARPITMGSSMDSF